MKPSVPTLLSFNAGYVDTAGFLALQGLFTAHVTGNFVTLGATLVHGSSGAIAKLLALPTFCLVVMAARLLRHGLQHFDVAVVRPLLGLKLVLLTAAAVLALCLGPFTNGDAAPAIATGLMLVAAIVLPSPVNGNVCQVITTRRRIGERICHRRPCAAAIAAGHIVRAGGAWTASLVDCQIGPDSK